MKDTLVEIKNNLQGNNSRVDESENQINDLEHKEEKKKTQTPNQSEQQKEKRMQKKNPPQTEDRISSLWDNFKRSIVHIIGVSGEEQEIGNIFEKKMKENFPNLEKEIDMQVQEAQRVPNKIDAKWPLQDTA